MKAKTSQKNELNDRAQWLFKTLVERYIRDGEPVGSKTLVEDSGLSLSSATIRNVLSDLEEQGYLCSPHTSAGRIPTVRGYRLFVDSLLTVQPMSGKEVVKAKEALANNLNAKDLVANASNLLSSITKLTGLVTIPKAQNLILQQVEFIPLSENRVLVVLVLNNREVQNRIIYTDHRYSQSELQTAANYLNHHFAGKDLVKIREHLKINLQKEKHSIDQLMQAAIEPSATHEDFVMSGQANLLNAVENADITQLRQLFDAFTQKRDILHLLDQCLHAQGVQLYIGEESGYEPLGQYSLITSPYSVDGKVLGALAVIGPTRMAYDRIIPIVDITAKLLTAALNQKN